MWSPLRWASLGLLAQNTFGMQLTASDPNSIKDVTSQIAYGMMKYYTGNNTGDVPGNLPSPYYWWEAGAMFMTMIEYWYYTGDDSYNDEIIQAVTWQAGKAGDFVPANQSKSEGNDDQVFWAYAAMSAAELNFPAPTSGYPSWLAMAQAVFNEQAGRWDKNCGGGLRWQIFAFNNGYNYKNQAANGGFFMLASRLARYTGNQTYIDWATKEYEWFVSSKLYENGTYTINDGTSIDNGCSDADHTQWSYNYGFYIGGLAFLYDVTQDQKWLTELKGILGATFKTFFPANMGNKIAVEITCEPSGNCDDNGFTFKGYTLRWMALAAQLVPAVADEIWPYIQASGEGAAGQCSGGTDGKTCGMEWNTTTWDGTYGVGQQMSALSAVGANMIKANTNLKKPYTTNTGGTSKGDPSAGSGGGQTSSLPSVYTDKVSTSDKAGAGIVTAIVLCGILGGSYWMVGG